MATERKIGGVVYRCDKLPAAEALGMLFRVSRFFAAYPRSMASLIGKGGDADSVQALLAVAMSEGTDADECQQLIIDLAQTCRVGSDPCIVGVKPAGLQDLIAVAWFAMEVNFKDFLAGSLAGISEEAPTPATAST